MASTALLYISFLVKVGAKNLALINPVSSFKTAVTTSSNKDLVSTSAALSPVTRAKGTPYCPAIIASVPIFPTLIPLTSTLILLKNMYEEKQL